MLNLYDLTKGNYRVQRTISYPDYPESEITFEAQIAAAGDSEWLTKIIINGAYEGPTDVVSTEDYQIKWRVDGDKVVESGSATLGLSSGGAVRQVWSCTIMPEEGCEGFPPDGELIEVSFSPFRIEGNSMSYNWEGTVQELSGKYPKSK